MRKYLKLNCEAVAEVDRNLKYSSGIRFKYTGENTDSQNIVSNIIDTLHDIEIYSVFKAGIFEWTPWYLHAKKSQENHNQYSKKKLYLSLSIIKILEVNIFQIKNLNI
jgi:hypothetical protein